MFGHILLAICYLILTNLCNGLQLNKDGQNGTESVKNLQNLTLHGQPPAAPSPSFEVCHFQVNKDIKEYCPLIQEYSQDGHLKWKFGTGENSGWNGGPTKDASGVVNGSGYMFADMQELICQESSAIMITRLMPKTEAIGKCLSFHYAIGGLNLEEFRVVMTLNTPLTLQSCPDDTKNLFRLLWSTIDTTYGSWGIKQITYSSLYDYTLEFIAIPTESQKINEHRSYVAIDNLRISNGHCGNDCNFNKNFCGWTEPIDTNLHWLICNAIRDYHFDPSGGDTSSGGMACITSERQNIKVHDKARLTSKKISHLELPKCMKFWVLRSGGEALKLRILKEDDTGLQTEIWSGTSKKEDSDWTQFQFTISDKNLTTDLKVMVEVVIVQPGHVNLAIDVITFEDHSCPIAEPPYTGNSIFDCTFDDSTCSWKIQQPTLRLRTIETSMVSRVSANYNRPKGHTRHPRKVDSYILFDFDSYAYAARDSGFLESPTFNGTNDDYCFSFWFLIYTRDTFPPSTIGSLSVIMVSGEKEVILWKFTNEKHSKWVKAQVPIKATKPFKLKFKATKGCLVCGVIAVDDISFYPHKCNTEPEKAKSSLLDCSFDDHMCGYKAGISKSVQNIKSEWQANTEHDIQDGYSDNTFDIIHGGFAFVSSTSPQEETPSWLLSPIFSIITDGCFTFYMQPLAKAHNASLAILSRDPTTLNNIELSRFTDLTSNGKWIYIQRTILAKTRQIVIEAKDMHEGGWAIDDINLLEGSC